MNMSYRVAAAAFVLSCLSGTTVASAQSREVVTTRVSRDGLDLSTAAGVRALNARVLRAARVACSPVGATAAAQADSERCIGEMRRDAAQQIAALTGGDRTELASR